MLIIEHRKNNLEQLIKVPPSNGVEIDIRSNQDGLYLQHDPFAVGESFSEWLREYRHSLLVLNLKEEGLEEACLQELNAVGVSNFFFLDQSLPFLVKRGLAGARNGACRASDYELLDQKTAALCDWVWVDSFLPRPARDLRIAELQNQGLKVCLVSPELHGSERMTEARNLSIAILSTGVLPDAVCTKDPSIWGQA